MRSEVIDVATSSYSTLVSRDIPLIFLTSGLNDWMASYTAYPANAAKDASRWTD